MTLFLDHAAAQLADPTITDYYVQAASGLGYINQEAVHRGAFDARRRLEEIEKKLSVALTGKSDFYAHFCASGSDGARLICEVLPQIIPPGSTVLTTVGEHPSVLKNLIRLFGKERVIVIPLQSDGAVDTDALSLCLSQRAAAAFFVHHVNSETGRIQDLKMIRHILLRQSPRTILIADTIQSAGKLPPETLDGDMFLVSGHKLGAPAYAAIVYRNERWRRHFDHLRAEYRCGRTDIALADTLMFAVRQATASLSSATPKLNELQRTLRESMKVIFPEIIFPVDQDQSSPWILSAVLPGYQGGVLVRLLSEEGVWIGSGSACQAETAEPSAVLTAMGFRKHEAFGLIRLSFSSDILPADALLFLETLKKVLKNY